MPGCRPLLCGGEPYARNCRASGKGARAPGKSALFSVTSRVLGTLAAGNYELRSLLTPLPAMAESTTSDNLIVANGTGGHFAMTVVGVP